MVERNEKATIERYRAYVTLRRLGVGYTEAARVARVKNFPGKHIDDAGVMDSRVDPETSARRLYSLTSRREAAKRANHVSKPDVNAAREARMNKLFRMVEWLYTELGGPSLK